jgi:hypothetical protein
LKRKEIMPGSRALKEITLCNEGKTRTIPGTKEKTGSSDFSPKQYKQTGKKYTGPNYPQKDNSVVYTKDI